MAIAPAVQVVVPIYNAAEDVRRLLASLQGRMHGHPVLLVDDASTDPAIAKLLRAHQAEADHPVELLRNAENLGFVGSVNRALAWATSDVVLLNSDAVVSDGWLPALLACAGRDARIASVTPWSNNAEICSLPKWLANNPIPASADRIAAALSPLTGAEPIDLPTAVGFCMWMRRACWLQIGDFDRVTFGRGYGEENDWCQRALRFGWRHVLCANAYVVHRGNASFSATGEGPGGENLRRLCARYPRYSADIAGFIAADPLANVRAQALAYCGGADAALFTTR